LKILTEPPLHGEVSKTCKKMYGTMADNHICICIGFTFNHESCNNIYIIFDIDPGCAGEFTN